MDKKDDQRQPEQPVPTDGSAPRKRFQVVRIEERIIPARRFRMDKIEERIALSGTTFYMPGHPNPHSKWVGG